MIPRSYSKIIDNQVRIYLQIKFLLMKQERMKKKIRALKKELNNIRGAKK